MSPLSLAPLIHNPDRQMVYDTSDKTECTYINDLKSMEDKVLQELEGRGDEKEHCIRETI